MSEVLVFGVSGNYLSMEHKERLALCKGIAAGRRLSPLVIDLGVKMLPVVPVNTVLAEIRTCLNHGDVGVLASGDPLFFGIGKRLLAEFGRDRVKVFPAVSAMQLACARFGVCWDDLSFLSLHGRNPSGLVGRILSAGRTILFTDNKNSPDKVAAALLLALEKHDPARIRTVTVRVGENLGLEDERVFVGSLSQTVAEKFAPLNMMLVEQDYPLPVGLPCFGLQENEICHSRGLITKDEVRAAIIHALRLPAQGVFWDVGGGSGSVSLEVAGISPALDIYTVEKKEEEQANITANVADFNRYNINLVSAEALAVLSSLPDPDRVFIGGSGGNLKEIIQETGKRIKVGGIVVVSAVLAKTAEQAPGFLSEAGFAVTIKRISVDRLSFNGERKKLNPITIVTGKK